MGFEINNNNELVVNEEGSIKIDGMFSDEEIQILESALEWEKEEIDDTTGWALAQLLHEDILPHLNSGQYQFSSEVEEDLRNLIEKHAYNTINLWINIPSDLEETLSQGELDLSIERAIWDIESYIARGLQLPVDSNVSPEEYNAIIWTTGRLIQNNIHEVSEIVEETKNENPHLSTRELTWIINSKISANFDDMKAHIISPLQLYLKYSSQSEQENLELIMREEAERAYISQRHPNPNAPVNRTVDQMVESRYNSLQQEHRGFERTMKDSFILWNIESIDELGTLDAYVWVLSTEYYQIQKDVWDNLDISLLNEADKEIEWKAMLYFLCAIWVQCLPYIWAAPWVVADATDLFTSQDATMMYLKDMWLVPEEYNIEKTWLDNILAWLWIALSVVWLQSLAKSWKLAKAVRWIKYLSWEVISDSLSLFTSRMWLWDEAADGLRWLIWIGETEPMRAVSHWKWETQIWDIIQNTDTLDINTEFPHSHLQWRSISEMKTELRELSWDDRKIRIQEIRDIVEYSQRLWVEIVRQIEARILSARERGENWRRISWNSIHDLADKLPPEYRNIYYGRFDELIRGMMDRDILRQRSDTEIVQELFWFNPRWKFDVEVWDISTNFNFYNPSDYSVAYWSWTPNIDGWFARDSNYGHIVVSWVPEDGNLMSHEIQHARFRHIAPSKAERPHQRLSEWGISDIQNRSPHELKDLVVYILQPQLKNGLDWMKDEALAYTYQSEDFAISELLRIWGIYDYTWGLRDDIFHAIKNMDLNVPDGELDKFLSPWVIQDYLRVSENIIRAASNFRWNQSMIDLLTITPVDSWWRIPEIQSLWYHRQDFNMNMSNVLDIFVS